MKKRSIFAVILLAAASMFIIVSCQKENDIAQQNNTPQKRSYYQHPKVDDMNAYLRNFKLKMQLRDTDETMDLDEAAWHLSSVANYDFGDAVNNYSDCRFDTLYYQINTTNGKVNLSDLNTLYGTISNDIESDFLNLDLENKHIRFINASISGDGEVVMSIMVTSGWREHQWYFPDPFTLDAVLSQYYDDDYECNLVTFTDTLTDVLNLLTAYHPANPNQTVYFILERNVAFQYQNYIDPYSTEYYYRIFYKSYYPNKMTMDDFYYYFDSYAGLAIDSLHSNPFSNEKIINWSININTQNHPLRVKHIPTVYYGIPTLADTLTPPIN